ncbi:MAG: hypothetical protein ACRDTF_22165 [Pseudonocardiaceae bacterium]
MTAPHDSGRYPVIVSWTHSDRTEFSTAYGYDITTSTGWTLIRDLTELHSLASYIRRAATNPAARDELHRRVDSLVTEERSVGVAQCVRLKNTTQAGELVALIAVPPKYTSADVAHKSYGDPRSKLAVPKEGFIADPDAGGDSGPTRLLELNRLGSCRAGVSAPRVHHRTGRPRDDQPTARHAGRRACHQTVRSAAR